MATKKTTTTTETKNWPLIRTYAASVKKGNRTIEQVPEKYRADVQALLEQGD